MFLYFYNSRTSSLINLTVIILILLSHWHNLFYNTNHQRRQTASTNASNKMSSAAKFKSFCGTITSSMTPNIPPSYEQLSSDANSGSGGCNSSTTTNINNIKRKSKLIDTNQYWIAAGERFKQNNVVRAFKTFKNRINWWLGHLLNIVWWRTWLKLYVNRDQLKFVTFTKKKLH